MRNMRVWLIFFRERSEIGNFRNAKKPQKSPKRGAKMQQNQRISAVM